MKDRVDEILVEILAVLFLIAAVWCIVAGCIAIHEATEPTETTYPATCAVAEIEGVSYVLHR